MNTKLFSKTMLITVLHYAEHANNNTYNKDFIVRLRGAINGYLTFHKLNTKESQQVIEIGKREFITKLKETEIDYSVHLMALMEHWVKLIPKEDRRNALNISDKKILQNKSKLILDMLQLKSRDKDEYNRVKLIVSDSELVAKKYAYYLSEELR